MIQYERRRVILEELRKADIVHIDDLIGATGASPSTVRRDIDALVEAGQAIALRGGAVRLNDRLTELPSTAKALINRAAKQAIAAAAAELVNEGDTVYIDSGTTALEVMRLLTNQRVHVITSNTHALTLVPTDKMRVTVVGGDYIASIGSIAGSLTERILGDLYFDKAFIGANGCSTKAGISTFDIREATKKRIVHDNSEQAYVVIDSSKFGKSTLCKALALQESCLITDAYDDVLAGVQSYIIASPDPRATS